MRLTELARRLEGAADEMARMRSELSNEDPLKSPGHGPAQELIAMVNSAWSKRQTDLASLTAEVTELAHGVRLAAERYAADDERFASADERYISADERYAAADGSDEWTR